MPSIKIEVKNKIATANQDVVVVCDNSDYIVSVTFDDEWKKYTTKTARITWNGNHKDVVFSGDTFQLPPINDAWFCDVGVYAGDLHTSTSARIACRHSALSGSGLPANPDSDVYAQIMELLNNNGTGGGENGKDGEDGTTPHIGDNGNWWLGDTDTGVSATVDTTEVEGYATAAEASAVRAEEAAERAEAATPTMQGNANIYSFSATTDEAVNGFTVPLPVGLNKFCILNVLITMPQATTEPMAFYSRQGGGQFKNHISIPTGMRGINTFILRHYSGGMASATSYASYPTNAFPAMPSTSLAVNNTASVTFYSNTASVNFPAGSSITAWGVYEL